MLPVASRRRTPQPLRAGRDGSAIRVAGAAASVVILAMLAACAPAPAPTATSSPGAGSPSPNSSTSAEPSATATPEPTEEPGASIELPAACEDIYSAAFLASMSEMTLNDPGVTLLSTELTPGLEILESAPTIRCSWGAPSEFGLATNVTVIDQAQAETLGQAMRESGMTCADYEQGTMCRIEVEHLTEDDVVAKTGETHYLRGNGWVSTHWINFAPEGYTEDIVAPLWG